MTRLIEQMIEQIRNKTACIGVIGLGYVGLPVACLLSRTGFRVVGIDTNDQRNALINAGQSPIGGEEPGLAELIADVVATRQFQATSDYPALRDAQVILICVETPIDRATHYPSYRALRDALASLGAVLAPGTLVIVESTIAPGTMHKDVIPELEKSSGKTAGLDFFVGHCPERVTPGLLLNNLTRVSRTVGGQTPEIAQAMVELYRQFVQADLDPTDLLTAEIVKTAENAYRDVQIAFANEVARVCEMLGADVYAVRQFLNKSPGRAMLLPGAGVGGHCIPKDPWLLIANVDPSVYQPRLIPAARAVNDQMPDHVVDLVETALARRGTALAGAKVAVLGYAFREDTDDDRDSPSMYVVQGLKARGAIPAIHDPHISQYQKPLNEVVAGAQLAVIMVAHKAYQHLDLHMLRQQMAYPLLIDGRNVVDAALARQLGFTYYRIGVGDSEIHETLSVDDL